MRNILHGLYNGNIIPWERHRPNNEKQLELIQKVEIEERYFMEKMSLDDCKRFQELSNLHSEILAEEENNIFSYAFTLGLLLMMDIAEETKLIVGE